MLQSAGDQWALNLKSRSDFLPLWDMKEGFSKHFKLPTTKCIYIVLDWHKYLSLFLS